MNTEELRAAHAIVAEGRAYTREHFSRPSSGYVGHTPAAQYDAAVDTLVAGLGAALDEAERVRDVARRYRDALIQLVPVLDEFNDDGDAYLDDHVLTALRGLIEPLRGEIEARRR